MANTYSKIYLHFVFAVRNRESLIPKKHKEEVHKYITALVQNRGAKLLAIHCMPDHIHLFVGFRPVMSMSDFVKEIKVESNEFINSKGWLRSSFRWQEGYCVFSYSHSQIGNVIDYINNQEAHHQKTSFRSEYLELLSRFEIAYDEKYVFDFPDDPLGGS